MTMTNGDNSSFGRVLKTFRTRRDLTQQALADALGIRRRTLVRWEQGDYLPESKTMVLELARCLKLDEQEARQLLEASLTALSPYWSVPLPRNSYFTGREEILEELHVQLGVGQAIALIQSAVLHGLGGVGKTQIALEYAYQHFLEYSAVFWIEAETEESIIANLLHIAEVLQLPEREVKDQQHIVAAVQHWLSTHNQWLLLWDNVEHLEVVQHFLLTVRQGALLITTRAQALGTLARGIEVRPMQQEEGLLFLLRRAKELEPEASNQQLQQFARQKPQEYEAARELVREMGGLPLALDQAGAYREETQCGLSAYLDLLHTQQGALLFRRGEQTCEHPEPVATTFQLAMTAALQRHPAVGDLLRVGAFLQPDAIPEELFRQGGMHLGEALSTVTGEDLSWNHLMAAACDYSLLSRQGHQQTFSLHRLVQAVVLNAMEERERDTFRLRVLHALERSFPNVGLEDATSVWKQCERLFPHALGYIQAVDGAEDPLVGASLIYKVARYLRLRGQYGEAEALFQRAVSLREQALGETHPDFAVALHELAETSREQGNYHQAEVLFQRALCILEQALGADHPEIVSPLGNLAILLAKQGKCVQATSLLQRVLHISEQTWGPDHPLMATALLNLATVSYKQTDDAQAVVLFQRALRILEQALGADHPQVAFPLNNLAEISIKQGKYDQALLLLQRAVRISEQALGVDHPQLAYSLAHLAEISAHQCNNEQAAQLYQRVLTIREQWLAPDHPDTGSALHDLALFRQRQGRSEDAITFASRALTIRVQVLGESHPHTVATRTLYTRLLQQSTHRERGQPDQRSLLCRSVQERSDQQWPAEGVSVETAVSFSSSEDASLQAFFDACCELHPRAWCRSADLWWAYQQWVEQRQERYPLSRRAFIVQLQTHGCCADRTKRARIWRGIALVGQHGDGG